MKKRARLKDIAELTGFSTNTVSLALHHSPLVAAETSAAIWTVARQLKYRPNQLARSLVNQQSKTIGLVLTNIQNPILTRAAEAIQKALLGHRYATLFATSNHSLEQEKLAIETFLGRQVDGLLVYPTHHGEIAHIVEAQEQGTPVVLLSGGRDASIDAVAIDSRVGAQRATEHLLSLGHRRIGVIDIAPALGNFEKQDGYRDALKAHGIALDRELIVEAGRTGLGEGYAAAGVLLGLGAPPTAILAANDLAAIGAIHRLDEMGISVPKDMSVVGFDNIDLAAHVRPPLTTVSYDADLLASRAVERLLRLIEADVAVETQHQVEFVEPELIVRNSTARPKG
ncbi:MAG: LacI family transcriptional regulator [Hyphomicrobiales bacterium]|nr:MAG: LacI family transcriptional regulator [Hyphomicrobiales bacterium]